MRTVWNSSFIFFPIKLPCYLHIFNSLFFIMGESEVSSQPSLYLAFRLARLVHKFRHRLQERVLVRKRSKHPFGGSQRRGLRLRASSDVEKYGYRFGTSTLFLGY